MTYNSSLDDKITFTHCRPANRRTGVAFAGGARRTASCCTACVWPAFLLDLTEPCQRLLGSFSVVRTTHWPRNGLALGKVAPAVANTPRPARGQSCRSDLGSRSRARSGTMGSAIATSLCRARTRSSPKRLPVDSRSQKPLEPAAPTHPSDRQRSFPCRLLVFV